MTFVVGPVCLGLYFCVAVASGYAAVGYHGDGVKVFHLETGTV